MNLGDVFLIHPGVMQEKESTLQNNNSEVFLRFQVCGSQGAAGNPILAINEGALLFQILDHEVDNVVVTQGLRKDN